MADPRIRAFLEILEFDCPPEDITTRLGVVPVKSWAKGELDSASRAREQSGWRIESLIDAGHDLELHALWLLDRLPPHVDLSEITSRWVIQLVFIVEVQDETPGMAFQPATLSRISALGAALDIDLYVFPEEHWV
jgi:hypothetical protein